jgi:hypothetical protein
MMFNNLTSDKKKILMALAAIAVIFIVYRIYRAYRKSLLNPPTNKSETEENFLTLRKGSKFCEKLCGGKQNKACMDECKTKEGFYGCC